MSDTNDKELLELAAKAAGIQIDYSKFNGAGTKNTGFDLAGNSVLDWHNYKTWNPLIADGDALRLAVNLNLLDDSRFRHERAFLMFTKNMPKLEATRRAFVLAAAAIGKAML